MFPHIFSSVRQHSSPTVSEVSTKPPSIARMGDSGPTRRTVRVPVASPSESSPPLAIPATSPEAYLASHFRLTPRQAEVLHWVAEGKTNGEIGIILQCSANTVKTHMREIFHRLGVHTRTAAAGSAYRAKSKNVLRLVESPDQAISQSNKSA
jgi:DNA-binding CsgD family transcriptional regulator